MNTKREVPIKVLVAKPGLDGHDLGAKVVARELSNAGMEVVYTGLRQTPEMIVESASQEDVDFIGLSILSGAHLSLTEKVIKLLHEKNMEVPVIVGGTIPWKEDIDRLEEMGVAAVFPTGTALKDIVDFIRRKGKVVLNKGL